MSQDTSASDSEYNLPKQIVEALERDSKEIEDRQFAQKVFNVLERITPENHTAVYDLPEEDAASEGTLSEFGDYQESINNRFPTHESGWYWENPSEVRANMTEDGLELELRKTYESLRDVEGKPDVAVFSISTFIENEYFQLPEDQPTD